MERELKKIPAYFRLHRKWFEYVAMANMTSKQAGAAFSYALAWFNSKCSNAEPEELPKDPATCLLALVMREEVDKCYSEMERGEFPFFYVDENGDPVGAVQNCTQDQAKEFAANADFVERMIHAVIATDGDSSK